MKYQLARHLRVMGSFFMGFIAGVGFVGTILSHAIAIILNDTSPFVSISIDRWTVHTGILWGLGAALLTWFGGMKKGLLVLGVIGVSSGAFLAGQASDWDSAYMLVGGLAGLIYGGGGGMLLGKVFDRAAD